MIQAVMYETIIEVEVSGSTLKEWTEDMKRLNEAIPSADREFNTDKKVWIIRNIKKYTHVPFIRAALENRRKQMSLF
jgi:hypothetical protein